MQHVDAQKETGPRKSHLLESLKLYLNNSSRLQPIIGLGSITECWTAHELHSEALYLCEVCVLRLSKADARNHIMGSLHRYNYIRARRPHLVAEFKDGGDLYKLARPLMEMAKQLEREEGPGDIKLLKVEDALYQRMLSSSGEHAMALVNILRDYDVSQSGAAGAQQGSPSPRSGRAVLFRDPEGQQMAYEEPVVALEPVEDFPRLQPPAAPPSHKEPAVSESSSSSSSSSNRSSFLDGYSHLSGLCRVLECQNEGGQPRCFLCHCCCQRTNSGGIVYHLSSSSHLINYLMEARPEQMQALMPTITNNKFPLQTLAQEVGEEEGRRRPEVVTLPESLCRLMSKKSYNWCLQTLNKSPAYSLHQKKKLNVKRPAANKTKGRAAPRAKRGNQWKANSTVFKVSLPLTEGPVLLQRTSFSRDKVPLSTAYEPPPPPLESARGRWPQRGVRAQDSELDCGEEEGLAFGLHAGREEEDRGNQEEEEGEGDSLCVARPDSLRVADVLSSLVSDGGSSEEGHDCRITRTVWLEEPSPAQSWSDGAGGGPLHRSPSEPAEEELWSRWESNGAGPAVGVFAGQNLETNSGQALCYEQQHQLQYQYAALGGAGVEHGAVGSPTNCIDVPLARGHPLAAVGGTAAEPQPAYHNHQWRPLVPIGASQAAPQGHAVPATAGCQTWGASPEMTSDQVGQSWPASFTVQQHCQCQHTVMWTLR